MHPLILFSESIQRTKSTQLKISLRTIEDSTFIDIRICDLHDGIYLSSKRGCTIPVYVFDEMMEALKKIESEVKK